MDLTYATIVVLASMMFVLSGMVGYLYWQQTRLQQSIQSLSLVVSSLVNPPALESEPEPESQSEAESERAPAPTAEPSPVSTEDEEEDEEDEEDDASEVEKLSDRVWSLETAVTDIKDMVQHLFNNMVSSNQKKLKPLRNQMAEQH